ncbi:MAG: TraB/GumN family protein [Acidobacteriota bacterium]
MKFTMKKSLLVITLLALFAGFSTIHAQTKKPVETSALLYEISGNGLKKPSYLFGTFHIICSNDMIQAEKLTDYIDKTEQLFLEVDLDDPAELQSAGKMPFLADGKTLSDFYTKEQYAKVGELVQNSLGAPIENFKNFKPFFVQVIAVTSPKFLGCSQASSYDLSFLQYAQTKQKPIEGLETVAIQTATIDSIPLKKQADDLYKAALEPEKSSAEFKKMLEIYKTQNSDKLFEFMQTQMKDDTAFQTNLLDKRNTSWIPKIEKAVKEKPSFIAVGAGHLGGKTGVLNLLRAKGYKVRAIKLT